MGQVTISVSGRNYKMACRDGEEKRVQELAALVESHVNDIKGGLKLVQEERLFLMTALMLADQLHDARDEVQRLTRQIADMRAASIAEIAPREPRRQQEQLSAVVETLTPKVVRAS